MSREIYEESYPFSSSEIRDISPRIFPHRYDKYSCHLLAFVQIIPPVVQGNRIK